MNNNLTELVLVVDRSGSMYDCASDAQGGINKLIEDQKKFDGECNVTLVQFDSEYDFVEKGTPIKEVKEYSLSPRGSTALLDAVGRTISETGKRLADMKEEDRPGLVSFVIVTDGYENASREFTRTQIRDMIKEQKEKYSWKFTFLGADEGSFAEAGSLGLGGAIYDKSKIMTAYASTSDLLTRTRGGVKSGITASNVNFDYTEQEKSAMS